MHEHRLLIAEFMAKLTDRLDERQAFNIADCAADLTQHEIFVVQVSLDELLDHVGDVRNYLHRRPQIQALAFPLQHRLVDAAGGDAVALAAGLVSGIAHSDQDRGQFPRHHRSRTLRRAGTGSSCRDQCSSTDRTCAERTRYPRACNKAPKAADATPLPREDATPPVIKMNFDIARR